MQITKVFSVIGFYNLIGQSLPQCYYFFVRKPVRFRCLINSISLKLSRRPCSQPHPLSVIPLALAVTSGSVVSTTIMFLTIDLHLLARQRQATATGTEKKKHVSERERKRERARGLARACASAKDREA